MKIISGEFVSLVVIMLVVQTSISQQQKINEEQIQAMVEYQKELLHSQMQKVEQDVAMLKTLLEQGTNEEKMKMNELRFQSEKSIQKLQESNNCLLCVVSQQLQSWSEFLKKLNEYVASFNTYMTKFNDKITSVMTKVVGFQQQLKAIVSLDTLIVCILSLVLVKILKDEFMEEGYQPVNATASQPIPAHSTSHTTLTQRDIQA